MKLVRSLIAFLFIALASTPTFAGPVNINKADAQALAENIRGVGEKIAERIVAYRQEHGQFANVEELMNVKGIGEKTVAKNRDVLKLTTISHQ